MSSYEIEWKFSMKNSFFDLLMEVGSWALSPRSMGDIIAPIRKTYLILLARHFFYNLLVGLILRH